MNRGLKSFITGMADVSNSSRKSNIHLKKNDNESLYSDWKKIGKDFKKAINKYEKENGR